MRVRRACSLGVLQVVLLFACQSEVSPPPVTRELEGARLLEQRRYDDARQSFRQALNEGGSYLSWIGIAQCEAHLGRAAAFEDAALRAASAAPHLIEAHDRLGRMYLRAAERFRNLPRARHYAGLGLEYLRRVFAAAPDTEGLLANIGLALILGEDDLGASVMLEEALRREPDRIDVVHLQVGVLRRLEQPEAILRLLEGRGERDSWPASWREAESWARSRRTAPAGDAEDADGLAEPTLIG